jgi:hypothetical protein
VAFWPQPKTPALPQFKPRRDRERKENLALDESDVEASPHTISQASNHVEIGNTVDRRGTVGYEGSVNTLTKLFRRTAARGQNNKP